MRITMRTIHQNILGNLNKLTTDMNRINAQISSGKQFSKISEDPVNLITALNLRTKVSEIEQYQDNIQFGDKAINAAENSLTSMKDLVIRAKVLSLQMINGSMTTENRATMAAEIQQLLEETITLSNTSVNGKYIFGGFRTTGYTDVEPTPFIQDTRDGYFVNGTSFPDPNTAPLTGSQIPLSGAATDITTGDLLINNIDVVATLGPDIDLTSVADTFAINMNGAFNIAQALNDQSVTSLTGSTDALTSPYVGVAATDPFAATQVAFYLNGEYVDVTTGGFGDDPTQVAQDIIDKINLLSGTTGVQAEIGTGVNGGEVDSIILKNVQPSNTSTIDISGLSDTEKTISGLSNNTSSEGVNATLTTLYAGAAATDPAVATTMTFYLNGETVNLTTGGAGVPQVALDITAAINAISDQTGVKAEVGTGLNGGDVDSIVLSNILAGDDSAISLTGLNGAEEAISGFTNNTSQAADATHNTGTVSLSSPTAFEITTNAADDTILDLLGLGGGNLGLGDEAADGTLRFGSRLVTGDLKVNGVEIITETDDISDIYSDASAAAKAAAINKETATTGVWAEATPPALQGARGVQATPYTTEPLTATLANNLAITAGIPSDLAINGTDTLSDIPLSAGATNGLFMDRALAAKDVINEISAQSGVTASLTTLQAGTAVDPALGDKQIKFTLNGVNIEADTTFAATAKDLTNMMVTAINAVRNQTGVTAQRGTGSNGGEIDAIVLTNTVEGDESPITLADLSAGETNRIKLSNGTVTADTTHNTGQITFASDTPFTITSPNHPGTNILTELGLASVEGITGDQPNDGTLPYGATPTYLDHDDLVINGINIFDTMTRVTEDDSSNAIIKAINAKVEQTGVKAGRNSDGRLILSAIDGRNIHLQTSAAGETITQLNGNSTDPQDKVYFGTVRLLSNNEYFLDSATSSFGPTIFESGFAALGLSGGQTITDIDGDTIEDGKIFVNKIYSEDGYVRYAGDRNNDFAIKVGRASTLEVAKNGEDTLMSSEIFTILNNLISFAQSQNFKTHTGSIQATDTTALLNSGDTGLEFADEIVNGSFNIRMTNHSFSPPTTTSYDINIDIEQDSLDDITQRINGIPGLSASWTDSGYLTITTDDQDRYSFAMQSDSSNFLRAVGARPEDVQVSNISDSIAKLDILLETLSSRTSDFGARSNRIMVQTEIYSKLELAARENLSEKEDTDMINALMEMKAKEMAYEAALSAAAKTMQMSLVDFLK
ncbi:MAG: hypothetical protein OEY01_04595 [Desulfobulbaceae bacterium]|nr:hypothetical protein [Desulfobulbaceae bacterium]HIJ78457.1 hypothetical protein [Deltaproteobacteria bacterium]